MTDEIPVYSQQIIKMMIKGEVGKVHVEELNVRGRKVNIGGG